MKLYTKCSFCESIVVLDSKAKDRLTISKSFKENNKIHCLKCEQNFSFDEKEVKAEKGLAYILSTGILYIFIGFIIAFIIGVLREDYELNNNTNLFLLSAALFFILILIRNNEKNKIKIFNES